MIELVYFLAPIAVIPSVVLIYDGFTIAFGDAIRMVVEGIQQMMRYQ